MFLEQVQRCFSQGLLICGLQVILIQIRYQLSHLKQKQAEILPLLHIFLKEFSAVTGFGVDCRKVHLLQVVRHALPEVKVKLLRAIVLITHPDNDTVCIHVHWVGHIILLAPQEYFKLANDIIDAMLAVL